MMKHYQKLIEDNEIEDLIKEGIEKEEDVGKIGFYVWCIAEVSNCLLYTSPSPRD